MEDNKDLNQQVETKDANLENLNAEIEKLKRLLSNANSESANYKRQLRDKQSAEEIAEQERKDRQTQLEQELADLKKQNLVAGYKAKFMAVGFDEATASANASQLADGSMDTIFSSFKTLTEGIKQNAVADALNKQGGLTVGETPNADDKPQITDAVRHAMGLK